MNNKVHRIRTRPFVPLGLLSLALLSPMLLLLTHGSPLLRPSGGIEFHAFDYDGDFLGSLKFFQFDPQDFPHSKKLDSLIARTDTASPHFSKSGDVFITLSRQCTYQDFIIVLDILDRSGFSSTYSHSDILTAWGGFYSGVHPIEAPWVKTMSPLNKLFFNLKQHNYPIVNRFVYLVDALRDAPWVFAVLFYWELICYANIYRLLSYHQRHRGALPSQRRTNGG